MEKFFTVLPKRAKHEFSAIVDGYGYFDVRDQNDKWIRIQAEKGDLLVIPGGIYHRFIPTLDDYIKGMDLFSFKVFIEQQTYVYYRNLCEPIKFNYFSNNSRLKYDFSKV